MKKPILSESNVRFEYFRSSGPGGQNVNKVATAVRLRFDMGNAALPGDVQARLKILAGNRMTESGELIIEAQRYRTQERNQQDALERLNTLIARAWQPPKKRKRTQPSRAAIEKRIQTKKKRGQLKQSRRSGNEFE